MTTTWVGGVTPEWVLEWCSSGPSSWPASSLWSCMYAVTGAPRSHPRRLRLPNRYWPRGSRAVRSARRSFGIVLRFCMTVRASRVGWTPASPLRPHRPHHTVDVLATTTPTGLTALRAPDWITHDVSFAL